MVSQLEYIYKIPIQSTNINNTEYNYNFNNNFWNLFTTTKKQNNLNYDNIKIKLTEDEIIQKKNYISASINNFSVTDTVTYIIYTFSYSRTIYYSHIKY